MATRRWLGTVAAVKQVSTITIGGTVAINDVITLTAGYASFAITMAQTGTADAAAQIQAAMSATGVPPELAEFVYTVAGSVVTATAKVAGVPITLSAGATGSATATVATPTAATGPNFANVAANWSGSALPTTGDTISIEGGPAILYGLTTITDVMANVIIEAEFDATIGLPETNQAGYPEYRTQYWALNTSALNIGGGAGRLSPRIKLNLGSQATAVVVQKTGQKFGEEFPVQLIGGNNATAYILGGMVAIAGRATETADYTSISSSAGSTLLCGSGVTHDTLDLSGDALITNACSSLAVHGGTTHLQAAAAVIDIDGGSLLYESTATLPDVTVGPGTLDCSDIRSRTITALELRRNAVFKDPRNTVTITALTLATDAKMVSTTG